jgi:hypothetical protein
MQLKTGYFCESFAGHKIFADFCTNFLVPEEKYVYDFIFSRKRKYFEDVQETFTETATTRKYPQKFLRRQKLFHGFREKNTFRGN